jgi:hypothetical protein
MLQNVPVGGYTLSFALAGYKPLSVPAGVTSGNITSIAVALPTDTSSSDGITLSVTSNLNAGYGKSVTLTATGAVGTDPNSGALTYAWSSTGARTPQFTTATNALTFTTLTLAQAKSQANGALQLGLDPVPGTTPWQGANTGEGAPSVPYFFNGGGYVDGGPLVPARFGPMGISEYEAGGYAFSVTATDAAGHSVTASSTVWATSPSAGLRNVPLGIPVWFEGDVYAADGGYNSAWSWTLTPPNGSHATLDSTTAQFVNFTPDLGGVYTLAEATGGESTSVYVADWNGVVGEKETPGSGHDYAVQNCTASRCHTGTTMLPYNSANNPPDMFTPWSQTTMGYSFEKNIDTLAPEFGVACIQCHTLGSNAGKTMANGGFDDTYPDAGYVFPTTANAGNYQALLNIDMGYVAQKTSIQCENCHGPASPLELDSVMGKDDTAAHSFSPTVCTQCHADLPFQSEGLQWETSLHANLALARSEGPSNSCGRCHSGQGYTQYVQQLFEGCNNLGINGCVITADGTASGPAADAGSLANMGLATATIQPQVCQACHDPHAVNSPAAGGLAGSSTTNPNQLRVYDNLPAGQSLMIGVAPEGAGQGLTCMICHNSRPTAAVQYNDTNVANKSVGWTPTQSIYTPHDGPQTDILYGVNAFFVGDVSMPSPHLAVKDSCVGCHFIPNAGQTAAGQSGNHQFIADLTVCNTCHGNSSNLVNGAALVGANDQSMAQLQQAIFAAANTVLAGQATGYVTTMRDPASPNATGYLCTTAASNRQYIPIAAGIVGTNPQVYISPSTSFGGSHVDPWFSLTSMQVTYASALTSYVGTAECTSSGVPLSPAYNYLGGPVVISISSAQAGPTYAGTNAPVFTAWSITGRAIYNETLLNNDLSHGVHNPPFFSAVISNTLGQLANVTAANP